MVFIDTDLNRDTGAVIFVGQRIEQGFAQVPEDDGIKETNAALTSERRKAKARTAKG